MVKYTAVGLSLYVCYCNVVRLCRRGRDILRLSRAQIVLPSTLPARCRWGRSGSAEGRRALFFSLHAPVIQLTHACTVLVVFVVLTPAQLCRRPAFVSPPVRSFFCLCLTFVRGLLHEPEKNVTKKIFTKNGFFSPTHFLKRIESNRTEPKPNQTNPKIHRNQTKPDYYTETQNRTGICPKKKQKVQDR